MIIKSSGPVTAGCRSGGGLIEVVEIPRAQCEAYKAAAESKFMESDQGQQVLLALKGIYAVIDERLAQTNVLLAAILDATNFKNAAPAGGKAPAAHGHTGGAIEGQGMSDPIKGYNIAVGAEAVGQSLTPPQKYASEKPCCTICDRKKVCHICGDQTLMACSDCAINFGVPVYVCGKRACREEHERRCFSKPYPAAALRATGIQKGE